ncbi:MAG: tRNA (adenosine(37)-N6)-dimethylallyltransferase MiaA [Candidatus Magasanikbacteria bacterium]
MGIQTEQFPKLVVLLGATTCGKTDWGLRLAKKHNGEIISADSRQIYQKMTIGTAKVPGEWRRSGLRKVYYVEDIPHYLVDFLDPGKSFTVAEFRDEAVKHVKASHKAQRIPFVVGGTGLYIHSLVDNLEIPRVPPNKKLRDSFEEKSLEELLAWLKNLDPKTAETVDPNNKRRIVRALEVCILSGEPFSGQQKKGEPLFDILQIGIDVPRDVLYERIERRVDIMIKEGLVEEVRNLLRQKYTWHLPSMSGIGYRQFKEHLENNGELDEAIENLKRDTRHYAKRQLTWFRRDQRIKWCATYDEAQKLVEEFLGT